MLGNHYDHHAENYYSASKISFVHFLEMKSFEIIDLEWIQGGKVSDSAFLSLGEVDEVCEKSISLRGVFERLRRMDNVFCLEWVRIRSVLLFILWRLFSRPNRELLSTSIVGLLSYNGLASYNDRLENVSCLRCFRLPNRGVGLNVLDWRGMEVSSLVER
eukprot:UN30272